MMYAMYPGLISLHCSLEPQELLEAEQKAKEADQRLQVMDDLLKEALVVFEPVFCRAKMGMGQN